MCEVNRLAQTGKRLAIQGFDLFPLPQQVEGVGEVEEQVAQFRLVSTEPTPLVERLSEERNRPGRIAGFPHGKSQIVQGVYRDVGLLTTGLGINPYRLPIQRLLA